MSQLVSVIVPVYNGAKYLSSLVSNLSEQSYSRFEVILVDDGSQDESLSLMKDLSTKNLSLDVKVVAIEHSGLSAARNHGIKNSSGKLISFLDCDDRWSPDKLQKQVDAIQLHNVDAVICDVVYIQDGKEYKNHMKNSKVRVDNPKDLLDGSFTVFGGGSNVMCKAELFDMCGGFDENLPFGEDFDLWLRITEKASMLQLDYSGVKISVRPDSMQRIETSNVRIAIMKSRLTIYSKWFQIFDSGVITNFINECLDSLINKFRARQLHEFIVTAAIWVVFFLKWIFYKRKSSIRRAYLFLESALRVFQNRKNKRALFAKSH